MMKNALVKMRFSNGLNIPINRKPKVNLPWFEFFSMMIYSLGHSVVEMSTKDFFTWLQQAETEVEEGEEEEGN